ncbi:unnamed protein product [Prunus armeniaca]
MVKAYKGEDIDADSLDDTYLSSGEEEEAVPGPSAVLDAILKLVQMARLARNGILEHFRAVLDLEWIAYAWAKMDGRF